MLLVASRPAVCGVLAMVGLVLSCGLAAILCSNGPFKNIWSVLQSEQHHKCSLDNATNAIPATEKLTAVAHV